MKSRSSSPFGALRLLAAASPVLLSPSALGQAFGPPQTLNDPLYLVMSAATADLNGDGHLDLVTGGQRHVTWFEGRGTGEFELGEKLLVGEPRAESVAAADLDADGDMDVLLAAYDGDTVSWLENLGGGVFGASPITAGILANPTFVTAADLTGDGLVDILAASSEENDIVWLENLGGGSFGAVQRFSGTTFVPARVIAMDLEGDGDLDVVATTTGTGSIQSWENLGGGSFGGSADIASGGPLLYDVKAGDLDGDGDEDLVATFGMQTGVGWYENQGGGVFGPRQLIGGSTGVEGLVSLDDLDGDGDLDVAVGARRGRTVSWIENLGAGSFGPERRVTSGVVYLVAMLTGDLDGDGSVDLVSASISDSRLAWYRNSGSGGFGPQREVSGSAGGVQGIEAVDFDGDGLQDVVSVSPYDSKVAWHKALAPGVFSRQEILSLQSANCRDVAIADFDRDGDPDVLVGGMANGSMGSAAASSIAWYSNLGGGAIAPAQPVGDVTGHIISLAAPDLNQDGWPDVLAAEGFPGDVYCYLNLAGAGFGPRIRFDNSMSSARSVDTGDLDGDGDLDVVYSARYSPSNDLRWVENLGGGSFASPALVLSLPSIGVVRTADMDQDGRMDVVCGGSVIVWMRSLGGGAFGDFNIISFDDGFRVDPQDVDGDGDTDVAVARSGDVVWYQRRQDGSFEPAEWIASGVDAPGKIRWADYDGDGDADVLAAGGSTNNVVAVENLLDPALGAAYCAPAVPNSTGASGRLSAVGSPYAPNNLAALDARGLPPGQVGLFLGSRTSGFAAGPGGSQGNLCLGGAIGRFLGPGQVLNADANGRLSLTLDLATLPSPSGSVSVGAGETWHFQLWYRDANPMGTSNFTSAIRVPFL